MTTLLSISHLLRQIIGRIEFLGVKKMHRKYIRVFTSHCWVALEMTHLGRVDTGSMVEGGSFANELWALDSLSSGLQC